MAERDRYALRPGEVTVDHPVQPDAVVQFIGTIRTPFATRADCPRRGDPANGPVCTLEVLPQWRPGLTGLERFAAGDILYWLDQSRRDLVLQAPHSSDRLVGTFAVRSPVRPNPIGLSHVTIEAVHADRVLVRGLDCLDGTPLIDIKPNRCNPPGIG